MEMAAGVTPEILEAWPREIRPDLLQFLHDLRRESDDRTEIKILPGNLTSSNFLNLSICSICLLI